MDYCKVIRLELGGNKHLSIYLGKSYTTFPLSAFLDNIVIFTLLFRK